MAGFAPGPGAVTYAESSSGRTATPPLARIPRAITRVRNVLELTPTRSPDNVVAIRPPESAAFRQDDSTLKGVALSEPVDVAALAAFGAKATFTQMIDSATPKATPGMRRRRGLTNDVRSKVTTLRLRGLRIGSLHLQPTKPLQFARGLIPRKPALSRRDRYQLAQFAGPVRG